MHVFFFTLSQMAGLECFLKLIFQDQELTPHISSVVHTRKALILDAYTDHRDQSNIRSQICTSNFPFLGEYLVPKLDLFTKFNLTLSA